MSPSQGTWPLRSWKSSCSRPAMAKLSPSRISTVVAVSRRRKAETEKPLLLKVTVDVDPRHRRLHLEVDDVAIDHPRGELQLDAEGLVLDGDRCRCRRPPGSDIRRRRGSWLPGPTARSGSVRPACARRLWIPALPAGRRIRSLPAVKPSAKPALGRLPRCLGGGLPSSAAVMLPCIGQLAGAADDADIAAAARSPARTTSDFSTERDISAKRTFSITCWVPPTLIRFDTLSGA